MEVSKKLAGCFDHERSFCEVEPFILGIQKTSQYLTWEQVSYTLSPDKAVWPALSNAYRFVRYSIFYTVSTVNNADTAVHNLSQLEIDPSQKTTVLEKIKNLKLRT